MTNGAELHRTAAIERLRSALGDPDSSARLQAALTAGTRPDPEYATVLVARCAGESDFYVRDMLTWALTRHPAGVVVPLLLEVLTTGTAQARSQALHTLSKVGDLTAWPAITGALLTDADDDVAKSAWRAAVALVPESAEAALAETLVTQLGRGGRDVRLSLSRAIAALGGAADDALEQAAWQQDAEARTHAIATQRLAADPDEGFDESIFEAKRALALIDAPLEPGPPSGVIGERSAC